MNKSPDSNIPRDSPTPAKLVEVLYRGLLGRDPEREGLRHWVASIEAGAGIWELLSAFMASPEYIQKARINSDLKDRASAIGKAMKQVLMGAPIVVVDVGAQALDYEDHVYAPLARSGIPCRIIGFEPLEHRRLGWEWVAKDLQIERHSAFVGDGAEHTFHINEPDATSSLLPFNEEVIGNLVELNGLYTAKTVTVKTETLDNILSRERRIDFLKLDIQGFELPALQHATETLRRTLVVHCEVSFIEIYEGQALFSEIEAHLRKLGFRFVDFSYECKYVMKGAEAKTKDQLGWADAVFFREFTDEENAEGLLTQSAIASLVYDKRSLASALALKYERLTGVGFGSLLAG